MCRMGEWFVGGFENSRAGQEAKAQADANPNTPEICVAARLTSIKLQLKYQGKIHKKQRQKSIYKHP